MDLLGFPGIPSLSTILLLPFHNYYQQCSIVLEESKNASNMHTLVKNKKQYSQINVHTKMHTNAIGAAQC